jgi:hypothetical protein
MLNSPRSFFFSIIMRCLFGRIRWRFSKSNQQLTYVSYSSKAHAAWRVTVSRSDMSISSAVFRFVGMRATYTSKTRSLTAFNIFISPLANSQKPRRRMRMLLCIYMCEHSGTATVLTNDFFWKFTIGYNMSLTISGWIIILSLICNFDVQYFCTLKSLHHKASKIDVKLKMRNKILLRICSFEVYILKILVTMIYNLKVLIDLIKFRKTMLFETIS